MAELYRDLRQLCTGDRFVVFRGRSEDGADVVIKSLRPDRPDPHSALLLRHEYELLGRLEVSGIAQPLGLSVLQGQPALLLKDAGPRSLAEALAGRPLPISEFLELALPMAGIVSALHGKSVIHRDLSPANFVLGDGPVRVTLVDFESATEVPAFAQAPGVPGELQGTLAYMAPEQTGRMKRLVDRRADLYSLGATFYEMLTGGPPFPAYDPLEVVHAHVARPPYPPAVVRPTVPTPVSDLVVKLLSKMPEWRYQTAEALAADLEEMCRQWKARGAIPRMELGRHDVPYGLFLHRKLYGRERETRELEQVIERTTTGASELLVVTGPAGIGKSALVYGLRDCTDTRCRWLTGKCDQLRGNLPYAPFIEAFRGLVRELLREPPEVLASLRKHLGEAIAPNGRVLTETIPDLEALLGKPPPAAEVGPIEAENRFHLVFAAFVRALSARGPPLVLFLDDLQWTDLPSLKLLRALTGSGDARSLLILCAYRSEEVGPDHPVSHTLQSIEEAGTTALKMKLGPLAVPALVALLCDVLRVSPGQATPLAQAVAQKTAGNPFFVRRFLEFLYREELLSYVPSRGQWSWDLARIDTAGVTTNVVDLLSSVIQKLPPEAQQMLKTAACIGNRFELGVLARVLGKPLEEVARALWSPIQQGLLVPTEEGPRFSWAAHKPIELGTAVAPTYRFVHDRIQQAAYQLLPEEGREKLHLRIGQWLIGNAPNERLEDAICAIVDQLNRAADWLPPDERTQLAQLNDQAGRQARATSAYECALDYFRAGLALLPPDAAHEELHPLWFTLLRDAAECGNLAGDPELCVQLVHEGLAGAKSALEKADLYYLNVQAHVVRGRHAKAIRCGREGLRLLGMELPGEVPPEVVRAEKERTRACLQSRSEHELLEAGRLEDPSDRARLKLLLALTSTWFTDAEQFQVISFRAAELTATRGLAPDSPVAYAYYAMALAMDGDYSEAYTYGGLAVRLAERSANPAQECRTLMCFAGHVSAWRAPLAETLPLLRRSYARGLESGELQFAAYAQANLIFALWSRGTALGEVLAEAQSTLAFYRKIHHALGVPYVQPYAQAAKCLKGLIRGGAPFDDERFNEEAFLREKTENGLGQAMFHLLRLQTCYLLGEPALAREYAKKSAPWLRYLRTLFCQTDFFFYNALTLAALYPQAPAVEQEALLTELRQHLRRLETWARNAPANYQHKHDLVAAELARLEEHPEAALALYQKAIAQAGQNGFQHDEALAHELCARFHAARGEALLQEPHLNAALVGYARWGATAKVELLNQEFPSLRASEGLGELTTPRVPPALDSLTLLKTTETLTGELDFERLLEKLVRTCVEAAAAERAVLVLDESGLVIRATATARREVLLEQRPLAEGRSVPISIIHHVIRSREVLLLGDAAREGCFTADPYVAGNSVRSVLVVPIARANRVLGVLYFENNLSRDAFAPERAEMLQLLSAQMAIALENSRLFAERARVEASLRLLSNASAEFAESPGLEALRPRLAAVAIPQLADWCLIDALEHEVLQPVSWAHVDASKVQEVEALHRNHPLDLDSSQPQARALRSGQSLLLSEVTEEMLLASGRDEQHVRSVRSLSPCSVITVPLMARGRVIGVATFALSRTGRRYTAADLALAQELGRRMALALDNAWLQRDLQETLRQSERSYSLLQATIEATADGLLVVDLHKRVVLYNQRFLSLWRIPLELAQRQEATPILAYVLDQIEDREAFVQCIHERYSRPDQESVDRIQFKDGRVFERYSRPQRLGDAIVGRVWSFRDISERERLLQRALFLSDATRLLGSLDVEKALEGVAHLVVQHLGDGCAIDLFNDKGPRRRLAASRDDSRSLSPELHPAVLSGHPLIYAVGSTSYLGVPLVMKGRLVGALTCRASPHRKYEQDDLEFVEELARRVALSLENAHLYHRAQEALRAREEFLSIAAHEIRGPTTSLHLAVQCLRKGKVPASQQPKVFDMIEREDRRLSRFVSELLELGRIQSGQLQFEYQQVDLGDVIRQVATRLRPEIGCSGSPLSITVDGQIVGEWDKARVEQIVTNLLTNALKFGMGKPIELTARARNGHAQLLVRDQGMGISHENLERIFKPFERGVSVRHYGGLGLGLHIVKTLVEGLGGSISVESEPGVGSTFTIQLPRGRRES